MKKLFLILFLFGYTAYGAEEVQNQQIIPPNHPKNPHIGKPDVTEYDCLMVFLRCVIADILTEPESDRILNSLPNYVDDEILKNAKTLREISGFSFSKDQRWMISEMKVQGELDLKKEFTVVARGEQILYGEDMKEKSKQPSPLVIARVRCVPPNPENRWGFALLGLDVVSDAEQAKKIWEEASPWPEEKLWSSDH
ncbi:MAG: hypothetical protein ACOY3I_07260 [Verrucomicrobiota bacterium]